MNWITQFWSRGKRSTLSAMRKIYGAKIVKEVLLATPDRRFIFESVSKATNSNLIDVLRNCGEMMGLPVLENIPKFTPTPELSDLLPEQLIESAVVPITNGGIHMGFGCVDPQLFELRYPRWIKYPLFLSSWSAIGQALEYHHRLEESPNRIEPRTVLENFLANMKKRMEQYNAKELLVDFESGMRFVLPIGDDRSVEGKVKKELVDPILKAVEVLLSEGNSAFFMAGDQTWTLTRGQLSRAFKLVPYVLEEVSVENPAQSTELSDSEWSKAPQLSNIDVVLVDDNDAFGAIVERFLGKNNVTSKRFRNGLEAFSWISSGEGLPKAIVTDLHMPVMNGFELVRKLSASEFSAIPIVVLTSDEDPEAEISMIKDGVETFVKKNQDPRLLCLHVQRILNRELKKAA